MDYKVKLNEFEGPLDLLLHLIKKSNIDIYDISIEEIAKQYLDYIHQMEKLDIEVTSSYLVMASELMLIKSKSLLPQTQEEEQEEDEELNRETLIERLIEYQKYKELTKDLKKFELERKTIYTKPPSNLAQITNTKIINDSDIGVDDLVNAFLKFIERKDKEKPLNTKIATKEYSVQKRKKDIKKYLLINKKAEFKELFNIYNKSYIIVTFMSILELTKENEINIKQERNFDNIYIELNQNTI